MINQNFFGKIYWQMFGVGDNLWKTVARKVENCLFFGGIRLHKKLPEKRTTIL